MKNVNSQLKHTIKHRKKELSAELSSSGNISTITRKLAVFIDSLLIDLFHHNQLEQGDFFCLIALGSYGRRELQLHSDIDLLLLYNDDLPEHYLQLAQQFIRNCWDIGLEVSHQITTVDACAYLASHDLSVISTLMDMHLLCGAGVLFEELTYKIHPLHQWPSHAYFFAKIQEQKKRHLKYGDTAYNLEPNIKHSPGGLRDLQILTSIGKRHFKIKKLAEGINYGFITDKEYEELMYCQHFLWRIRFALHMLADKAEERLSFDYQVKLAQFFGYQDTTHSLAIEQFMKDYFKVIKRNRELNEMLLQWFDETIVHQQRQKLVPLDTYFQLSNNYIEVRHSRVFQNHPHALISLFVWIAQNENIQGVRASTIRLIRSSLYLINKHFKQSPQTATLFLSVLKNTPNPYEALQQMSRYGVLAHYLECFSLVTGQMQYDLFHAYTVDQHTLFVIRNCTRFKEEQYKTQFPLCAQLIHQLKKPDILYLSALFHDIAKGRGGDHSELGALEAEHFAQRHLLTHKETHLLTWLVKNHLLLSQTAQRKDIYAPETIKEFCAALPSSYYLDYLYLLTVADICGTNPSLWNAWKDSLLKELYYRVKDMMRKKQQLDEQRLIEEKKEATLSILMQQDYSRARINDLWSQFKSKYFLYESSSSIAYHTAAILDAQHLPLVMIMPHHTQGGMELLIYTPHQDERFTITTTVLANHQVTIQEALISTCNNQFDLDIYIILDEKHQAFLDHSCFVAIKKNLIAALNDSAPLPSIIPKRISRTLAHFDVMTQVSFNEPSMHKHTELFLITNDRPGLLATIGRIFLDLSIHLHNAKIVTVGERVEDTFYLTNQDDMVLSIKEKEQLTLAILQKLSKK